jgi:hypothetical protein
MFRITCFVKDTKLADVLRLLDGKAYNVSAVPARSMNGDATEVVEKPVRKTVDKTAVEKGLQAINSMPETFTKRALASRLDISNTALYNALQKAIAEGKVKRLDKKGTYRRLEKGKAA